MLWKEILIGFLIAGFLMVLVPDDWWKNLFITQGTGSVRLVENAIVGPLIAVASFVCSCGNIPLASVLVVGRHQFRRRHFIHLCGLDHHSAHSHLPEILRNESRALHHRRFVRFNGELRASSWICCLERWA